MAKNYYDTLGIKKWASADEIKKAYKKQAMKWHPDKHSGDKKAEEKFKEINEAYQVLSDPQKKKQYDQFGTADFGAGGAGGFGGFGGGAGGFDFSDLFGWGFGGGRGQSHSQTFDFSDLFGGGPRQQKTEQARKKEEETLDVIKKEVVSIFDLLLGIKLPVTTVYNDRMKLNIPAGTKPGTKFKIKGKGRKSGKKQGDMYVVVEAKMPKDIPEHFKKMLQDMKETLG